MKTGGRSFLGLVQRCDSCVQNNGRFTSRPWPLSHSPHDRADGCPKHPCVAHARWRDSQGRCPCNGNTGHVHGTVRPLRAGVSGLCGHFGPGWRRPRYFSAVPQPCRVCGHMVYAPVALGQEASIPSKGRVKSPTLGVQWALAYGTGPYTLNPTPGSYE